MDNFADRDHCIQYMCAVMLVYGRLEATDYTDGGEAATSPLVEDLRKRITCVEDPQFTLDYHREEAKPEILAKYKRHLGPHFSEEKVKQLVELGNDAKKLENMAVDEYVDLYEVKGSKFL
jgi:2-methylcitrate dehydratase